jgi:hypothetical protein
MLYISHFPVLRLLATRAYQLALIRMTLCPAADAYNGRQDGSWEASAATPAPLSGGSVTGDVSSTEQSSREENREGALAGLAHMAEKGVQRVAANIGASNDDSGPVLGNVNTR